MAASLSADVIVIGSGICGSLAARSLAASGASVLMLEAGPRVDRGLLTAGFRGSARKSDFMSPYPYSPLAPHPDYAPKDNGYLIQKGPASYKAEYIRVVGGTTWHWAAQAWRLLPNDFRLKTAYGVGRDWPISYDDLEPYYYRGGRSYPGRLRPRESNGAPKQALSHGASCGIVAGAAVSRTPGPGIRGDDQHDRA